MATRQPRPCRTSNRVSRRWSHILWSGAVIVALSACDPLLTDAPPSSAKPQARPARPVATGVIDEPVAPSEAALELRRYYTRVQEDLLAQGLLRTDGGSIDTPYTDEMLARNFERIALAEEYSRGAGLLPSNGDLGEIKKWILPVRVGVTFGDTVPADTQALDRQTLEAYTRRLARVTGHPISTVTVQPNFHVLVMGEDDKAQLAEALDRIAPRMEASSRAVLLNLPRSIHCLVVAFAETNSGSAYRQAIALIRSEHPDLARRACFHEELAQGLGLANDSPQARPSIFNDDEEFALLTTHDELLLKILYDDRLRTGMSAAQAAPIARRIATELMNSGPS